jgi:hypothetical protein
MVILFCGWECIIQSSLLSDISLLLKMSFLIGESFSGKIGAHPHTPRPAADSLDKSGARTRETEQNLMTIAYASSPRMLAIDRRIFDIPEERLQGRTSDLAAWTKTMLPTIRLSISEAQNQLRTGHQDIPFLFL